MFVELLEYLRCPRSHEESSLIVSATRTRDRHIVDGVLGCPVCNAEFRIEAGVARFTDRAPAARPEPPSDEAAMRLAAFLQLTDARGAAALCGRFASHAGGVAAITDAPLVVVNAPTALDVDAAASLVVDDSLPLAAGSLRGAAIDESVGAALAASVVRAVRSGGRLVGAAPSPVPAGVTELARDDRVWIAEKDAAPEVTAPRLVSIGRAPR